MTVESTHLTKNFGERAFYVGVAVRTIGQGPLLFLLHGGVGSRTHWSRNIETLSENFKVATLDLPGFGESARVPAGLSTQEYLAWVATAVRAAVNGQSFHLVGFSFGATVSAGISALMSQQGCAPLRLSLVSPSGFGKPQGRTISLEKVRKTEDARLSDIKAATARNLGRWMLAKEPDADDPVIDLHLENVSQSSFDSRRVSHGNSLIRDVYSAGVTAQILLGEKDPLIFPSVAERRALLHQSLPDVRVELIPDAGHWLQYEASNAVNVRINQFHL